MIVFLILLNMKFRINASLNNKIAAERKWCESCDYREHYFQVNFHWIGFCDEHFNVFVTTGKHDKLLGQRLSLSRLITITL